ncbi:MAG: peptide chain release factor 3 [Acidobacteriota bacterium]|nr:peptide chain release factor 3 [Acidobacteriota bacterium]MDH3785288.1 peptide chain release factor 3 [Acidobacteriota bacterium]
MELTDTILRKETERRRTFAIISHPDAGKTTLTEKLLLYGGAIRQAGAVRARRAARHATSDWLELEKQRGISVSSSVMTFEHHGLRVNILDTPGHHDFSEDTYRTLTAADSAVMLIDAAKGVEPQTRKLFQVCRMRGIPIFTFINKWDRRGHEPLDLMSEIEEVLGIHSTAANWPIGAGSDFSGIYDRLKQRLSLFKGGNHGTSQVEEQQIDGAPDSEAIREALGTQAETLRDELELLDGAGESFDRDKVARGELTPVFFGSALTNFGVFPLLENFLDLAPSPQPRESDVGPVDPLDPSFSGFVFKIQANMDPDHRDRVAFVRVCSGRFLKGETTTHVPSKKKIRLANSTLLMAQDRQEVDEAYPGDVVGLFDPGTFRIGDTLSDRGDFNYAGIPSFSPEHFARVHVAETLRRKALTKGLDQLTQEGLVQLFSEPGAGSAAPVLGAVGPLQFEVLKFRMESEYSVELKLQPLKFKVARWLRGDFDPAAFIHSQTAKLLEDREGQPVLLVDNQYSLRWIQDKHEGLEFLETAG